MRRRSATSEGASGFPQAFKTTWPSQFRDLDELLARAEQRDCAPDYQAILNQVAALVGGRQGAIFLRTDTGTYRAVASLKHPEWALDPKTYYRPGEGVTGWIALHNRPLRIRDLRHREELQALCPEAPPVWKDKFHDGRDEGD